MHDRPYFTPELHSEIIKPSAMQADTPITHNVDGRNNDTRPVEYSSEYTRSSDERGGHSLPAAVVSAALSGSGPTAASDQPAVREIVTQPPAEDNPEPSPTAANSGGDVPPTDLPPTTFAEPPEEGGERGDLPADPHTSATAQPIPEHHARPDFEITRLRYRNRPQGDVSLDIHIEGGHIYRNIKEDPETGSLITDRGSVNVKPNYREHGRGEFLMRAAADELVGREVERWDANFISPFAVRAAATVFGTDAITYHEGSQELPMTTDQAAASTARVQEQTNRGETAERLEDYSIQARIDLVRYAEHRAAEASVPEVSNGETERDVNMVYQLDPVRETGRLVATTDVGTLTRMVEVDAATGELTSPRGRADIRGYIEQGEQVAADLTNQAARELAARGVVRWDDTYSTAGEVAVAEQVFGSERITYYDFSPRDQYDNIEIPLPMTAEQAAASAERSEDELEGVWAHVDLQGLARPTEARAREVDLEQSRSGRDVEVVSTESCDVTIDRSYPDQSSADRLVESALADTLLEGWEPIDANPANPDTNRKYYVDDPANPTFFAKRTTPPLYEFDHPLGLGAAEVHQAAAVAAVVDSPEAQAIVRANDFTGISYVRPILSVTDTDFAVETTIYSWQAGRILAPSDVTKPFPPGSEPERAEMAENQLADLLQSNGIIAYDLNVRQLLATDDAPGGSQLHLIDAEQFQITIDDEQ